MQPGCDLGTCDFRENSLFYNMLILERTIGVASMEVQGVGSLPSQIHFLLYIVTLLVLFKAFSGRMLEHTPPLSRITCMSYRNSNTYAPFWFSRQGTWNVN